MIQMYLVLTMIANPLQVNFTFQQNVMLKILYHAPLVMCVCVSLQPFWPIGTGIGRGFLAALDSAWMVRSWSQGNAPLDVLAAR